MTDPQLIAGFVRVVVEVEVEGERRWREGTGYRVRPGDVLTAAHLLRDSVKSIRVVPQQGTPWDAEEAWKKDEENGADVALLRLLETGEDGRIAISWARKPPQRDQEWWSYGYPGMASPDLELESLRGDFPVPPGPTRFEVYVKAAGQDPQAWKGISGAPVFVGSAIHGVIGQAVSDKAGRFHATSLYPFLDDPDLRALVGESWEVRREQLVAELERLLRGHDLAIQELVEAGAERAPAWARVEMGSQAPRALAEAICETEIGPVLWACNRAYQRLRASAKESKDEKASGALEASETVGRLISKVAPLLTAFQVGLQLPDSRGGLFQLPCRTPTVFELLIAVVEGREPYWKTPSDEREYPRGEAQLAAPSFESGAVVGQVFWDFARSLAKEVFHPNDFPKVFAAELRPAEKELDPAVKRLDLELEGIAGRERKPFRYYLILDEVESKEVDLLADEIQARLRSIWLLRSDGGDEIEEARWCQPLRELLFERHRAGRAPS